MSRRTGRIRLDAGEIATILGLLDVEIEAERTGKCGSGDPERMRHLEQLQDKMTSLVAKVAGQAGTTDGG